MFTYGFRQSSRQFFLHISRALGRVVDFVILVSNFSTSARVTCKKRHTSLSFFYLSILSNSKQTTAKPLLKCLGVFSIAANWGHDIKKLQM